MKKSLARVLSLVLVLVMMLGVLPMASAEELDQSVVEGGYISAAQRIDLSESTSARVVSSVPNNGQTKYNWSVTKTSGTGSATVSGNTSGSRAVDLTNATGPCVYTISCVASWNGFTSGTKSTTVTFFSTDETVSVESVTLNKTTLTMTVGGDSATLTATVAPEDATNKNVTWSSSDEGVATVSNGTVTAVDAGDTTITVTTEDGSKTATCAVHVTDPSVVTPSIDATKSLTVGGTVTLTPTYTTFPTGHSSSDITVTWASADNSIATVNNGVVTAVKASNTPVNITATFAVKSDVTGLTLSTSTAACAVTVTDAAAITVSNISVASGTTATITPKLMVNGTQDTGATFEFTGATAATGNKSATLASTTAVVKQVTVTLHSSTVEGLDVSKVAPVTIYVSFYADLNDISVTMNSGDTELLFSNKSDLKNATASLAAQMLYGVPVEANAPSHNQRVVFSVNNISVGELVMSKGEGSWEPVASLGEVKFKVKGSGSSWTFAYNVVDNTNTDVIMAKGRVTINFDGVNEIEYSTDYKTAVTLKEADFASFWSKSKQSGSLRYVIFGVSNSAPYYGDIYRTATATTANKLTSSDYCYYGTVPSGGQDLGSITYVPYSGKTTSYYEEIPFTAYGTTGASVSGVLVFKLNDSENAITSRGIYFGSDKTKDYTYADAMAEAYAEKSGGKSLGYVVFSSIDAEDGTLYSNIPTRDGSNKIASATRLGSKVELYYNKTTGKTRLQNIAFVPAAGADSKVTLYYTAYDTTGANAESMSITFNVQTRTASAVFTDVTAKGYSWAADSVDFLYYEGTAQGSNGKYNPAANITRRDFMLMLYRAFLEEDYGTYSVTTNFPDVVKGSDSYSKEIYQAVGVAKYLGIAQGTNNKFNPTSNITRQEAMVLIYRTLEVISKDLRTSSGIKATSFKDYSKIGSWATTAISSLVSHGVIQGTNDYINPLSNITRAEMACILHRVITY